MGAPAYNNQFMGHAGPRGAPGMVPGAAPTRGPSSMGPMYGPAGMSQRGPQHPNYGPGPQQGHPRPQQVLKRSYNPEVSLDELQAFDGSQQPSETVHSFSRPSQEWPPNTASQSAPE